MPAMEVSIHARGEPVRLEVGHNNFYCALDLLVGGGAAVTVFVSPEGRARLELACAAFNRAMGEEPVE